MLRFWSGLQCFASFIFLNVGATQQARTGLQGEWRLFFSRGAAYSCFKALLQTSCMNIFAYLRHRKRSVSHHPKASQRESPAHRWETIRKSPRHDGMTAYWSILVVYTLITVITCVYAEHELLRKYSSSNSSLPNRTDRSDKGPDLSSPLSLPLTLPLLITHPFTERLPAPKPKKKTIMMDLNLIIMICVISYKINKYLFIIFYNTLYNYINYISVCVCAASFHLEVWGPRWFLSVSLRPTRASRFLWEAASSRPAPQSAHRCTSVYTHVHSEWIILVVVSKPETCGSMWQIYALRLNWTSGIRVDEMWPDQSFWRRATRWQVAERVDLIGQRPRWRPEST